MWASNEAQFKDPGDPLTVLFIYFLSTDNILRKESFDLHKGIIFQYA
jgi:hypothetical protein